MPSTKKQQANSVTVTQLANEFDLNVTELIPLIQKMGLKNAQADTIVPDAIASNARIAVKERNNKVIALPQSEQPKQSNLSESQPNRKLKRPEVKEVAQAAGITQSVVKGLDKALHDRECQLAFLEGYQQVKRKQELQAAQDTGKAFARLEEIQRRDRVLAQQEQDLVEEGLSDKNHPYKIAESLGFDINGLLGQLEKTTNQQLQENMNRDQSIQEIVNGNIKDPDKLDSPFLKLIHRRLIQD